MAGCATDRQPPLYQWQGYQTEVREYFKGGSPEAQITKMEEDLQKIRANGKTPPPGYHAHLGLLYAQIGKTDQVVQEFQTEKTLFPESAAYMDFLLRKYSPK